MSRHSPVFKRQLVEKILSQRNTSIDEIAKEHGVWFEEAQTVWADTHAEEFFDPDHSGTEDRFIRLISARKATSKEVKEYEEGI